MGEQTAGYFEFESRESYEQAKKETEKIQKILEKTDISNPKIALKLYNKADSGKIFSTISGYFFLLELRQQILESGLVSERALAPIPIKEPHERKKDVIAGPSTLEKRYLSLYEGQKLLNKKLKITILGFVILIIGFVFINFRFEYSIFTYFTNYKANMDEELIDKYEKWESDLQERENKLEQRGMQSDAGKE